MSIKFTKQADGTFLESGDLPVGTRTVLVYIDGVKPSASCERNAKEHVETIRDILTKRPQFCPAQEYELREFTVTPPEVIAKRTAQLMKARATKDTEGGNDDE